MDNDKIKALAINLDCKPDEINEGEHDDCLYYYQDQEYLVLTDDEADRRWDEYLDSYIDDVIFGEIPEPYQMYFDEEHWKQDARIDGRGHSLSFYDGGEDYETVNGEDYYIYRQQ